MEVLKSFNFKEPIVFLKSLKNGKMGAVDAQNSLRIIDSSTYAVIDGFKTNMLHERAGSYVDVSDEGEYMVSVDTDRNQATLFSLSKRKQLYKVQNHNGEIESVAIDPEGRYFVTGGEDGKSYGRSVQTSRSVFSLPPHADYVSTIVFSDDAQWIATGSYDRTINLFNVGTMKEAGKLRGHSDTVKYMAFLPQARLLSVDRSGGVILWDVRTQTIIKKLPKLNDDVSAVCVSSNKHFMFVGTKSGYVALYDLQTVELVSKRFIKTGEEIGSLCFLNDPIRLVVGGMKGTLRIYPLYGDEEAYMQMLLDRKYKAFYDTLEENPMLVYSPHYEALERIWTDTLKQARELLEKNERDKAKELFEPFRNVPKKNALINQILTTYEKYEMFQNYIKIGRLPLAYSLAKQHPVFQESELYRKMEAQWKKVFCKAQELVLLPNGEEQAKTLLAPYRGISEKTALIQQLFEQRKGYDLMKKVLSGHDYVKFFALVKMYPFLKEFPEYASTMEYGDILYVQAQKAYAAGEYPMARKACKILLSFPDYAKEAQEMDDTIRIKHLFFQAIASNDLANAFSYLDTYPLLYETAEAQLLERQWNSIVDNAQRFASIGSITEIFGVFEPYFGISNKYKAMGSVLAQGYCVQLEQKIQFKEPIETIESGIRQYVEIFGLDEGIRNVYDYFQLLYQPTCDIDALSQNDLFSWTPTMRIDDITVMF